MKTYNHLEQFRKFYFVFFIFLIAFIGIQTQNNRIQPTKNDVEIKISQDPDISSYLLITTVDDLYSWFSYVYVDGNIAYLDDGYAHLRVYELEGDDLVRKIGDYEGTGPIQEIIIENGIAFVACEYNGIHILNVNDPSNPTLIRRFYNNNTVYDLDISNDILYSAVENSGIHAINISNVFAPIEIWTFQNGEKYDGIVVKDNFAFLSLSGDYLQLLNFTNFTNSTVTDSVNDIFGTCTFLLHSNYIFITQISGSSYILNVTNPVEYSFLNNYISSSNYKPIIIDNLLYTMIGSILNIYNITDLDNIIHIRRATAAYPTCFAIYNEYLLITQTYTGFLIYTLDSDADGLSDTEEINDYHTDPESDDSDDDSLTDYEEIKTYKTNPNDQDTDGDGLHDYDEITEFHTDPNSIDTDGDNLTDYEELFETSTDPTKRDTDGDGTHDDRDRLPNSIFYPGIFVLILITIGVVLCCVGVFKLR